MQTHPSKNHDNEEWVIGIMVSVTIVKFMLMMYCRRFENAIVRAYAQDHFFDVITNSIGLAATVLAVRYYWWIDPVGAIIVSTQPLLIYFRVITFLSLSIAGFFNIGLKKFIFTTSFCNVFGLLSLNVDDSFYLKHGHKNITLSRIMITIVRENFFGPKLKKSTI